MPPTIALFLWLVLLLVLLRFDPARTPGTSSALWVPLIWIFIVASRLPSQWIGQGGNAQAAEALTEGNPFDRVVYTGLMVLAVWILVSRSFDWGAFCRSNVALTLLIFFMLVSVLWSDYPFIAFK